MKKLVLWLIGGGLLGIVAAVVGGNLWLQGQLSPESLVQHIEQQTNARAQIQSVQTSLLAQPAEVIISGVQLSPRDAECGKPLAQRAALPPGAGLVNVERITLRLPVLTLLSGPPIIQLLKLEQVNARSEISKEGVNPLAELFHKPEPSVAQIAPDSTPAPVVEPSSPPATETPTPATQVPDVVTPSASPAVHQASFHLMDLQLSGASLHIVDRQTKVKTDVSQLQLQLTDLAPGSDAFTAFTLSADLKQVGRARLSKDQEPQEVNHLTGKFTAEGKLTLLQELEQWVPAGNVKLALAQGSVIAGYKSIGQNYLGDVAKYAPELAEMKLGGELMAPLVFQLKLAGPRTEIVETAKAVTSQYEVQLRQGSWLDSASRSMETKLTLIVPLSVAGPAALLLPSELKSQPGKLSLPVTLSGPMDDFQTRWLE